MTFRRKPSPAYSLDEGHHQPTMHQLKVSAVPLPLSLATSGGRIKNDPTAKKACDDIQGPVESKLFVCWRLVTAIFGQSQTIQSILGAVVICRQQFCRHTYFVARQNVASI